MTHLRRGAAAAVAILLTLAVAAPVTAYPRPGTVERLTFSHDSRQINGHTAGPVVTPDGRFLVFTSTATNLVPGGTNGRWHVYVLDRQTGTTEIVSVSSDGVEGNFGAADPSVSDDGRYVAFKSESRTLVPGGNSRQDIYLRDRNTAETKLVTVGDTSQSDQFFSTDPALSADGSTIAFISSRRYLVEGPVSSELLVYLYDVETDTIERLYAPDGSMFQSMSWGTALSADGQIVAFESYARNLVPDDTNEAPDVFVYDRAAEAYERVSVASDGSQADGPSDSADVSADGRLVAFSSSATNLVPGTNNGTWNVYVHDRETGVTERVSVASDGTEPNDISDRPRISADGRFVAFQSPATNLADGVTGAYFHSYVHDRETGVTELVSVAPDGAPANGLSAHPAVNGDGSEVTYVSTAVNLATGITNGMQDLFGRKRGPAIGIGDMRVVVGDDSATVSGWATASGAVVAKGVPAEAASEAARELDAALTGARLTVRPEAEDLLVRWDVEQIRSEELWVGPARQRLAGTPGVVYGLAFVLAGERYELRVARASASLASAQPAWGLYRCGQLCDPVAQGPAGIGTVGDAVLAALPVEALPEAWGQTLTGLRAYTALGEPGAGGVELHEASLPDAQLAVPTVHVGVAPEGQEPTGLAPAALDQGAFSAELTTGDLPPGRHTVWARSCLAGTCGDATALLRTEGDSS